MSSHRMPIRPGLAAAVLAGALALAGAVSAPATAQYYGGGGAHSGRGDTDSRNNRVTVSIRVVTVGDFCVRAIEAVGYDPRLNTRLYRIGFDSGPMTSLGVTAYENAFSSARTQGDAMAALSAAHYDARPYRRGPGAC
ncbi:hypothetical protein ACJ4V0_07800 [Phreatobacter sp. HK31-P]